jgi:hypothetical protein
LYWFIFIIWMNVALSHLLYVILVNDQNYVKEHICSLSFAV